MTRDAVVKLFARRDEAWKRLDSGALAADHAEDSVLESALSGTVTGRPEIERVLRAWFAAFPDLTLRTDAFLIDGDRVAQFGVTSGTDTGGFMGQPATGKAFQLPFGFYFLLGDDRILRWRTVYGVTDLLVQVGMLRTKPA